MPKEDYFKIHKFQVLQQISSNDLEKDLDLLKIAEFNSLKTYLIFRDELMRDFEKNKQIFEKYSSHKKR